MGRKLELIEQAERLRQRLAALTGDLPTLFWKTPRASYAQLECQVWLYRHSLEMHGRTLALNVEFERGIEDLVDKEIYIRELQRKPEISREKIEARIRRDLERRTARRQAEAAR